MGAYSRGDGDCVGDVEHLERVAEAFGGHRIQYGVGMGVGGCVDILLRGVAIVRGRVPRMDG